MIRHLRCVRLLSSLKDRKKKDGSKDPRLAGAINAVSRCNVPTAGRNDDLETKLKNFIRNELDKARKEWEHEFQEEREKRVKLEELVSTLAEQVEQLQAGLL